MKPPGSADIAHKQLVAKRLSQCLNPELPSGVHQKTLEVYGYIFSSLGKDGLSDDLSLYLPGLAPSLSFAALSVKPNILAIFETYIVQCRPAALRSALKALILALLPCLEEENSDEFEWTLRILESLKTGIARASEDEKPPESQVNAQFFWQCLFLTCMTSTSRRAGALAYLTRNLPRLGPSLRNEDTKALSNGNHAPQDREDELRAAIHVVASPEPGLLIRCFCAGLQDEQHLTQRGFLDLLVTHLPLNSPIFQGQAVARDLERLVSAATSVVARRDMSLNRRLWSWFLGPEPAPDALEQAKSPALPSSSRGQQHMQDVASVQIQYFEEHGLHALVGSIQSMIKSNPPTPGERSRPFRVCLSLMDRWEIGGTVAPHVFIPCMESVWHYFNSPASKSHKSEVLKSASAFFDSVESALIWSELSKVTARSFESQSAQAVDMLNLVYFVSTQFNIREEEMQMVHLPLITLFIILRLQAQHETGGSPPKQASETFLVACKIIQKLLEIIPARALTGPMTPEDRTNGYGDSVPGHQSASKEIAQFYVQSQGGMEIQPPFQGRFIGEMALQGTLNLVLSSLRARICESSTVSEAALEVLVLVIRKCPKGFPSSANVLEIFSFERHEAPQEGTEGPVPFPVTVAKAAVLEVVYASPDPSAWLPTESLRRVIPFLVTEIWSALSPSNPVFNVDAVQCIWRLQAICGDTDLVESTLVMLMTSNEAESDETSLNYESFRRFMTLWNHSPPTAASNQQQPSIGKTISQRERERQEVSELSLLEQPLFRVLDVLRDKSSLLQPFVANWLQSLGSIRPILDVVLTKLTELDFVRSISLYARRAKTKRPAKPVETSDGPELCLYYLQSVQQLMQQSPTNVWPALANSPAHDGELDDSVHANQELVATLSLQILRYRDHLFDGADELGTRINQIALFLLRSLLLGPISTLIIERMIEEPLIEELKRSVERAESSIQQPLMETVLTALQARIMQTSAAKSPKAQAPLPSETPKTTKNLTLNTDAFDRKAAPPTVPKLPPELLDVIKLGVSSPKSRSVLDHWISFVNQCLPLYEGGIFQILIPLIECFCTTLQSVFSTIQSAFGSNSTQEGDASEPIIGLLMNGLEQSLATAHDALSLDEPSTAAAKSPEQQQTGFFGNMVSGVFSADNRSKTMTANNRLTVLLCFKDAIRVCYSMWTWGDTKRGDKSRDLVASYNHTVLRLRNRTRRVFEHLFNAEALECLETLIDLWQGFETNSEISKSTAVLNLLNVLESSKPKNTIPAIFNAVYSRTNPSALDPTRKSTLTSSLSDTSLAAFLVTYVRSLEDDTMDEIWPDCLTFLRDVLANPMPHRQTLPRLLEFTAVLGEKVDNTTFGEQRKMRRELGDLFVRLLAAALATGGPVGFSRGDARPSTPDLAKGRASLEQRGSANASGLVAVLATIMPNISKVLVDTDRIVSTTHVISTSVISPMFRSKIFPDNVDEETLDLLTGLLRITEVAKTAKKDVGEAFNDAKFFSNDLALVEKRWLPILRSWSLADKERMPELLARTTPPTTAGIMFGVGANSARLEADRRTQLNLRRIATLILASDPDTFVPDLKSLQQKLIELMGATTSSSPSSMTRAEVCMVLRALILKTTAFHLSSFWPILNSELYDAIASSDPTSSSETLNPTSLLQACKLLDALLTLNPDDFQLQEWLFVSDTTDAVYRPSSDAPVSLVDDLSEALDAKMDGAQGFGLPTVDPGSNKRRPLLASATVKGVAKENLLEKVVHPFFRQLSIHAFESTYSLQPPDWDLCFSDLLRDVFDDSTLV